MDTSNIKNKIRIHSKEELKEIHRNNNRSLPEGIYEGAFKHEDPFLKEEMEMKDRNFEERLRILDEKLSQIDDPERADYLILTSLRDMDDLEAEEQIRRYELKFGI